MKRRWRKAKRRHVPSASSVFRYLSSYQPLNVYWAEQDMVLHTEFREGNVPAGFEQKRVLKEALGQLPGTVQRVRMRSDTAGYRHELLSYCERTDNKKKEIVPSSS